MAVVGSVVGNLVGTVLPVCGRRLAKQSTTNSLCRRLVTMAMTSDVAVVDPVSVGAATAAVRWVDENLSTTPRIPAAVKFGGIDVCTPAMIASKVNINFAGVASLCGRRVSNEDRTVVRRLSSDLILVGIFDGHGGSEAADFVSDKLPELLAYWLEKTCRDYQTALRLAFIDVNDRLSNELVARQMEIPAALEGRLRVPKNMLSCGTTATVCLLRGDSELIVAQVGDSRATLCRADSGLILTADHSPDDPRELDRILRCSGHVTETSVGRPRVNGILEMTRSIGDIRLKQYGVTAEPEIVTVELDLDNDRFLILTTDGIHNTLNTEDVINSVLSSVDATEAASSVVDEALFYGSTDNCTALVLPLAAWNSERPSTNVVQIRRPHRLCSSRV